MKASVIPIGNSRGVRIPRGLLEQCALRDTVELEVRPDGLLIRPARRARAGWEEAFQRMAQAGDDALVDAGDVPPTQWESHEWRW